MPALSEEDLKQVLADYEKLRHRDLGDTPPPIMARRRKWLRKPDLKKPLFLTKRAQHITLSERVEPPKPTARSTRQTRAAARRARLDIAKADDSAPTKPRATGPLVGTLRSRAASFQEKVLTEHSQEALIKKIKDHSDQIDFAMLNGFLPINIRYEEQRFLQRHASVSLIESTMHSVDIDLFLRLQPVPEPSNNQVPLI